MKRCFSPAACSLSPHIALHEAGFAFETERVDLGTEKTASGEDFAAIRTSSACRSTRTLTCRPSWAGWRGVRACGRRSVPKA